MTGEIDEQDNNRNQSACLSNGKLNVDDLVKGRYRIQELLEQSALGEDYLCRDELLTRIVVLKRLNMEKTDLTFSDLLERNQTSATANHENVVTVYDSVVDENGAFLVTEMVDGVPIDEFAHRDHLEVGDCFELAGQILDALISAHVHEVMHGDLKPSQVKIVEQSDGRYLVKLLNFGLTHLLNCSLGSSWIAQRHTPRAVFFMAPESFRGQSPTPQTDLYSLGCILYHAVGQHYPFDGKDVAQVMMAHQQHMVHDLSILRPDYPHVLCEWIMWLMSKNPEDRPATAVEALQGLQWCYNQIYATA